MRRWARRRPEGDTDWHWLAPPDREGGLVKTVCGQVFDDPDDALDREYSDAVPTARRCPACQLIYARVIRQTIGVDPRL